MRIAERTVRVRFKEYSGWRETLSMANFGEKRAVSALFCRSLGSVLRQVCHDRVDCAPRATLAGGIVADDREGELFSVRGCNIA